MKVALITGASSGIGKALAYEYAQAGYNLGLAARNLEQLTDIAKDLQAKYKTEVVCTRTDVSQESDCAQFVQQSVAELGRIDVLINNAGISMRAPFGEVDLNVLRQLMDVNFWGTVYCTRYALPYIIASRGSIVGVSSIAGFRGLPERTGYSSSKFAMQGFLESLRTELLPAGVHVLTACPGFTQSNIRKVALVANGTAQGESPRNEQEMDTAEHVAHQIYVAVQKRKRTLVLTRIGKLTVFLNKFLGAWMDKKVYQNFQKENSR